MSVINSAIDRRRTASPRPRRESSDDGRPAAHLASIGLATPAMRWPQAEIADRLAALWRLDSAQADRWRRIIEGSCIEARHGVMALEEVVGLSTQQRMEAYERHAPFLAADAARRALDEAGVDAAAVTDLIVVSCTGFSAPGVDVALAQTLGLRPDVRRTCIGFMGCYGAIIGLRAAIGACGAHRDAVALVVCVELCSLHVRPNAEPQNMVASALFGDGAAAVIVHAGQAALGADIEANDEVRPLGRLESGSSLLLPEGRDWMTWRVTDTGFAMTLTREVPVALRAVLRNFVEGCSLPGGHPASFAIHPGGPGILDAADAALELGGGRGLDRSRAVLRRIGNVSSATVLFVLKELIASGAALPAMLMAFGPGLSIESAILS